MFTVLSLPFCEKRSQIKVFLVNFLVCKNVIHIFQFRLSLSTVSPLAAKRQNEISLLAPYGILHNISEKSMKSTTACLARANILFFHTYLVPTSTYLHTIVNDIVL